MSMPFKGHVVDADAPTLSGHTVLHQWFRAFRAAVGTHGAFRAITLSGDFTVTVIVALTEAPSTGQIFLGDSTAYNPIMALTSDERLRFRDNAANIVESAAGAYEFHQLNTIVFDRSAGNVSITYNGNSVAAGVAAAPVTLSMFAAYAGGLHMEGKPLLFEVLDHAAPESSFRYSNFTRPDDIVPNELATLGAELVSNCEFSDQSVWQKVGNAVIESGKAWLGPHDGSDYAELFQTIDTTPGMQYRIGVCLDGIDGDTPSRQHLSLRFPDNAAQQRIGAGGSGYKEFLLVATSAESEFRIVNRDGAGTTIVSHVSVRPDDTAGILRNPADGSISRYTKKGQAWLGVEQALANSSPVLGDDSDPEYFTVVSANELQIGSLMRISAEFDEYSGVADVGWSGSSGVPTGGYRGNSPSGRVVGGDYVPTHSADLRLYGRQNAIASFKNITARKVIPIADGAS